MESEITVSEIYQTSTTTKPNYFQLTVVAKGEKALIRNYAKRIGSLTLLDGKTETKNKCADMCHAVLKQELQYNFCPICGDAFRA